MTHHCYKLDVWALGTKPWSSAPLTRDTQKGTIDRV